MSLHPRITLKRYRNAQFSIRDTAYCSVLFIARLKTAVPFLPIFRGLLERDAKATHTPWRLREDLNPQGRSSSLGFQDRAVTVTVRKHIVGTVVVPTGHIHTALL